MVDWKTPFKLIKIGTGRKLRNGEDVAVLTIGAIGNYATKAVAQLEENGISAAHYDMRFVKPLDDILLHEVFGKFKHVVTVEDGCLMGGMGSAIVEWMSDHGYNAQVKRLGIPDRLVEHGTQDELYAECHYDAAAIVAACEEMMAERRETSRTA
jgi:1-deoxy-D-xylulose-5-phosphate synthase